MNSYWNSAILLKMSSNFVTEYTLTNRSGRTFKYNTRFYKANPRLF
jgi:hypothetical protein